MYGSEKVKYLCFWQNFGKPHPDPIGLHTQFEKVDSVGSVTLCCEGEDSSL